MKTLFNQNERQNYLPIDCRDPPVNLEFNPLQLGLLVKPNVHSDAKPRPDDISKKRIGPLKRLSRPQLAQRRILIG